jgi:hypothetical protein
MAKPKFKANVQKDFDTFVPVSKSPLGPEACIRFFVLRACPSPSKPAEHTCQKQQLSRKG